MSENAVLFERIESVANITLNRPHLLNSINTPMAQRLQSVLDELSADTSVRAVLITGSGRAFCAGQDLEEALPQDGSEAPRIEDIVEHNYNPIVRKIRSLGKPVICAVNGVAAGAGANLALACDFVLASSSASFIQAFCKIGLIPDSGGTFYLSRLVGVARATAMMMLGDKVTAEQAFTYGMIYKVCDPEALLQEAQDLAQYLSKQPTKALGLIKLAINASLSGDFNSQLDLEQRLQGLAGQTEDYHEGVQAFLEKRKPNFKGK